jgi:hypothetical protein
MRWIERVVAMTLELFAAVVMSPVSDGVAAVIRLPRGRFAQCIHEARD